MYVLLWNSVCNGCQLNAENIENWEMTLTSQRNCVCNGRNVGIVYSVLALEKKHMERSFHILTILVINLLTVI